MFRCDQCDNGITQGESCPYCGAPAQWDKEADCLDSLDEHESIYDRSERRAEEATRADGRER